MNIQSPINKKHDDKNFGIWEKKECLANKENIFLSILFIDYIPAAGWLALKSDWETIISKRMKSVYKIKG